MPSASAAKPAPSKGTSAIASHKLGQLDLQERESAELVLALSGAAGCGIAQIVEHLSDLLSNAGYDVEHIKVSKIIEKLAIQEKILDGSEDLSKSSPKRYELLQTAGNKLRSNFAINVLAELAISRIITTRTARTPKDKELTDVKPKKTAYIVDQLKNPAEVATLRSVYGNLFYLIGVFASEEQRRRNLSDTMDASDVQRAIDRDRAEEQEHGQQLDKTLKLADLFVRNSQGNRTSTKNQLERLLKLIHGSPSLTPTKSEYAMYAAHSAALRSACLSRQVGAAITDEDGNLLATGCNDVPKPGGGLYSADSSDGDLRCYNWKGAKCWNDHHKSRLEHQISSILQSDSVAKILNEIDKDYKVPLPAKAAQRIAGLIKEKTRLKDLLEFSRAVHAEMDAIMTIARKGGPSLLGGQLFSTTFPCHNCARQLVAAGLKTVFYIEPYEKSLALDLHQDAIVGDPDDSESSKKVRFLHFEGISPLQYQRLFFSYEDRKANGKLRAWDWSSARKSVPQFLDNYIQLEARVMKDLESRGISEDELAKLS